MTELLFWETTIRQTPVSFAVDIGWALVLGIHVKSVKVTTFCDGWHDLTIYLGPLSLTFTVYGRGA
jgi:hypothetical protein